MPVPRLLVRLLGSILVLSLAAPAAAVNLGRAPAAKRPGPAGAPAAAPAPGGVVRQGGDTIAGAVELVALPALVTGTTIGYTDDYDEVCPYEGSTSPDVVYTITPAVDVPVTIDLLGSAYDTKVYVYAADLSLIACNDDHHEDYTSFLTNVPLAGGEPSYIVVDGYGGAAGDYVLACGEFAQDCDLVCPAGGQLEGEPPLVDGYQDVYNSGCGGPTGAEHTDVTADVFCGRSGWYLLGGDLSMRDTDWLWVTLPASGTLEITADAEWPTYVFELAPPDCESVGVVQTLEVGRCQPNSLVLTGEPGRVAWVWVGPRDFAPPGGGETPQEYDYVLQLSTPVAVQPRTWSAVRELYR
jgi:hypothetical protein